jgi:hypothetical protein
MNPVASVVQLISEGLNPKAPKSSGPLTLVPLFGGLPAKEYVVGADAFADGSLSITEVDHDGDVTHLEAHNKSTLPVLLIDGEHLEGAKQNRILNASVLVAANRTSILPVACVEQGRWSYETSSDFAPSADIAYSDLRSKNAVRRAANVRASGSRAVSQSEVWSEVERMHDRLGSPSETGAMKDSYDHRRDELDVMKQAFTQPEAGQSGVIACIDGRPVALDAFDRPETLSKLWPRLLSGYALDALGHAPGEVDKSAIKAFLARAAAADNTSHEGLGLGMDVVLTAPDVVGNALTWEDGVVHLALFARSDDPQSHQGYRAQRIERPSRRGNRIAGSTVEESQE